MVNGELLHLLKRQFLRESCIGISCIFVIISFLSKQCLLVRTEAAPVYSAGRRMTCESEDLLLEPHREQQTLCVMTDKNLVHVLVSND